MCRLAHSQTATLCAGADAARIRAALAKRLDAVLASQLTFAEPVWTTSHIVPSGDHGAAAGNSSQTLTLLVGAAPVGLTRPRAAPLPAPVPALRRPRPGADSDSSDSDDEEEMARLSSAAVPVDRLLSESSLTVHRVSK